MAQDPSTLVNSKIAGIYGCSKKIWYDSSDMIGFDPDPHGQVHQKDAPHQGSWRDHRICAWCLTSWRRDGRNHTHPSPGRRALPAAWGQQNTPHGNIWDGVQEEDGQLRGTQNLWGRWFSKHLKMLTHEDSSPLPHMQASYHIVKPTESTTSMTCQPQMGVGKGGMLPNHHFNRGKCADSNPLEMGAQSVFKQLRSRGASASARHHVSLLAHLMQQRLVWKVKLAVSKWKLPATQLISAKIWRK